MAGTRTLTLLVWTITILAAAAQHLHNNDSNTRDSTSGLNVITTMMTPGWHTAWGSLSPLPPAAANSDFQSPQPPIAPQHRHQHQQQHHHHPDRSSSLIGGIGRWFGRRYDNGVRYWLDYCNGEWQCESATASTRRRATRWDITDDHHHQIMHQRRYNYDNDNNTIANVVQSQMIDVDDQKKGFELAADLPPNAVDPPTFPNISFIGPNYWSMPLTVPLTLSYDITCVSTLPQGYGFSVFLVTQQQHSLLAAGSAFESIVSVDNRAVSYCTSTTQTSQCLAASMVNVPIGVGSVFSTNQTLYLAVIGYSSFRLQIRYNITQTPTRWTIVPAGGAPVAIGPLMEPPVLISADLRVNTPGRRISMYLVEVGELAKWNAGQSFSWYTAASVRNATISVRGAYQFPLDYGTWTFVVFNNDPVYHATARSVISYIWLSGSSGMMHLTSLWCMLAVLSSLLTAIIT